MLYISSWPWLYLPLFGSMHPTAGCSWWSVCLSDRRPGYTGISTVKCPTTVVAVRDTNLLEIVAKVPAKKLGHFAANPASYAYLNTPSQSRTSFDHLSPSSIHWRILSNPFTVASIDEDAGEAKFVVRQGQGPTTDRARPHRQPQYYTKYQHRRTI
jgi:hypothetical protein